MMGRLIHNSIPQAHYHQSTISWRFVKYCATKILTIIFTCCRYEEKVTKWSNSSITSVFTALTITDCLESVTSLTVDTFKIIKSWSVIMIMNITSLNVTLTNSRRPNSFINIIYKKNRYQHPYHKHIHYRYMLVLKL